MKKKSKTELGPVTHTQRGFEAIYFTDRSGVKCLLQQSSLADFTKPGISAVWLGVVDADPRVLASQAHQVGIKTDATVGWVPYPVPPQVMIKTEVHLSREQAAALVKTLQCWLEYDTFKQPKV